MRCFYFLINWLSFLIIFIGLYGFGASALPLFEFIYVNYGFCTHVSPDEPLIGGLPDLPSYEDMPSYEDNL